jgi:FAD dependent oxidoreductase TIGR03364
MARKVDVAIVGAGILGLAHALAAAKRGLSVVVFERDERAVGASVRNFGLGLVVGQAPGEMQALAMASRRTWLEVLDATRSHFRTEGSVIVARDRAEMEVLESFQAQRGADYDTRLLGTTELGVLGVRGVGGLASPHEIALESRVAIPALASWLAERHGVEFIWNAQVNAIELPRISTSRGKYQAERVIICAGHETQTLYPDAFATLGLRRCRLQMQRVTNPGITLGPTLMTGLSTLHYPSFAGLPTLPALQAQVATRTPALVEHGIHLIVQQVGTEGDLIIGDSHDYGITPSPFASEAVDDLILNLAQDLLGRPLTVRERWQGVYGSGDRPYAILHPAAGVTAITMMAGIGMSVAFALAEQQFKFED